MTTAVDDLFHPDPLAHFVPTKYIELEWTPLDVKIFSFPKEFRYNQLRLMCLRIQGLLENAGPNTLDDLIPLAKRNTGKVALTSPLAFFLVARGPHRAFKSHNEDERILHVEMNWVVTIVTFAMRSFAAYINHTFATDEAHSASLLQPGAVRHQPRALGDAIVPADAFLRSGAGAVAAAPRHLCAIPTHLSVRCRLCPERNGMEG